MRQWVIYDNFFIRLQENGSSALKTALPVNTTIAVDIHNSILGVVDYYPNIPQLGHYAIQHLYTPYQNNQNWLI